MYVIRDNRAFLTFNGLSQNPKDALKFKTFEEAYAYQKKEYPLYFCAVALT